MSEQIISKTCRVCKQTKPLSEFYKALTNRDGFRNECKVCYSKYQKEYRQTERGKAAKKRHAQSKKGKAALKRYKQSKKGKTTDKRYAQSGKGRKTIRTARKRYKQSEKGKTAIKRQAQSEKGRATIKRHQQSEKYKATKKRYSKTKKGREVQITARKRFNTRHPEQIKAKDAVNHAVKSGRLPRPDSLQCHYCPAQAKEYHHYKGYAPEHRLDVVPVCIKCHNEIPKNQFISATA